MCVVRGVCGERYAVEMYRKIIIGSVIFICRWFAGCVTEESQSDCLERQTGMFVYD